MPAFLKMLPYVWLYIFFHDESVTIITVSLVYALLYENMISLISSGNYISLELKIFMPTETM